MSATARQCNARVTAAFRSNQPDALILLTQVPAPENYGDAALSGDSVVRLLEKPTKPKTDLALVGVYMFTSCVHDAARAIKPSAMTRGVRSRL